jgi:hypothetical protein
MCLSDNTEKMAWETVFTAETAKGCRNERNIVMFSSEKGADISLRFEAGSSGPATGADDQLTGGTSSIAARSAEGRTVSSSARTQPAGATQVKEELGLSA